jgi:hypothetical protein
MPLPAHMPIDTRRYPRHEATVRFSAALPAGDYVYVQDCAGVVWVLPNGSHLHPQILGRARPVVAAGELTLGENGVVLSLNNDSGTFRCAPDSLFAVVGGLVTQGATVKPEGITRIEV